MSRVGKKTSVINPVCQREPYLRPKRVGCSKPSFAALGHWSIRAWPTRRKVVDSLGQQSLTPGDGCRSKIVAQNMCFLTSSLDLIHVVALEGTFEAPARQADNAGPTSDVNSNQPSLKREGGPCRNG